MTSIAMITSLLLSQALAPSPSPSSFAPSSPSERRVTLTLAQALADAEQQNPELAAARAHLEQINTAGSKAWSAYLPQLKAQGGYTRNSVAASFGMPTSYIVRDMGHETGPAFEPSRPVGMDNPPGSPTHFVAVGVEPMEIPIQVKNQWGAQLSLTQGMILPEAFVAIRNASRAEKSAALSFEGARREILFAAARAYLGAAALRESVDVQEAMLEVRRDFERDAQAQFEAGAVPEIVVLRAAQERANQEQHVERTRASYVSAISALAALLARPMDFDVQRPSEANEEIWATVGADSCNFPPSPEKEALALRPEIAAAQKNLEYAEGLKSGVIARYLPNMVASANLSTSNVAGFTGEKNTWNVGVGVSWNILDGGLRRAQLKEASGGIAEARAKLRAEEERVKDELRRAEVELCVSEVNLATARKAAELARRAAGEVKSHFDAGLATYLEVMDANTALAGAELGVLTEGLNMRLARVGLMKARGEWGVVEGLGN